MSKEELQSKIYDLIERNGPMGVNKLAEALMIPTSTMQKYLDKDQSYFKKNHARKWVLPETAAMSEMSAVASNYSNIIDSQLKGIDALLDTLMSQFRATITLIESQKTTIHPVAGFNSDIDPYLIETDKKLKDLYKVFKQYVGKCPEEYQSLIKNVDLAHLVIDNGTNYLNGTFNTELTSLFLEQTDKLSDEVLETLKNYQKEAK